ncbi:MAG TPA: SagB/ThcOx family dehydrogenase [Anaerolineales bacterium]|nr:SagB/ThcOx family dehydrogenase [Anaerolineales bacterium]
MDNWDTQAAWRYHRGTIHPNGNLMDPSHTYDNSMRPLLFKIYPGLEPIPLPLDKAPVGMPALEAISQATWPDSTAGNKPGEQARVAQIFHEHSTVDLPVLARILFFSAGVTRHIRYHDYGIIPFRAAACTGALYHIELYTVCGDLPGLEAGVYHFDASQNALRRLRQGDYRPVLVAASGAHPALAQAPAILICTDVFYRNAVKYQAREYRHAFWDSGTILANLLAMAAAHQLHAQLLLGFEDDPVNRLLDLDEQREATLALVALGSGSSPDLGDQPEVVPLGLEVQPVAKNERFFPSIYAMHRASCLADQRDVAAWRERAMQPAPEADEEINSEQVVPIHPLSEGELPEDPIEKVISRRGSTRRFTRDPISFEQLSTLLASSTRGISADFLKPFGARLDDIYLIVNAVDALQPGTYVYHPSQGVLERLSAGAFRRQAGGLALGQDLAADASANIFFLADLERVLERFGNRGYRAAQLEASLIAGRMYLAAYAMRFGASGLTFYDDYVTDFFSPHAAPHAAGKSVMFLIALGVPAKR